jgi:hypothetical protein
MAANYKLRVNALGTSGGLTSVEHQTPYSAAPIVQRTLSSPQPSSKHQLFLRLYRQRRIWIMATSEYRFTQSTPVLRELARTNLPSPPPPLLTGSSEYTENVTPFKFIDESLSLLGHLQRAQDNHIRREFEQQRDLITSEFEREQSNRKTALRRDECQLLKNRRLQKPDVKSFPTDIKKFWKLQARENGRSNSSDRLK